MQTVKNELKQGGGRAESDRIRQNDSCAPLSTQNKGSDTGVIRGATYHDLQRFAQYIQPDHV